MSKREELQNSGVYFPHSVEDEKMRLGKISAGNGMELTLALKNKRKSRIIRLLTNYLEEAIKHGCNRILLSSEVFVHYLAIEEYRSLILKCCAIVGIDSINAMGFWRNLSEHCLSTYKHRAKSGKRADFIQWMKSNYEVPHLIKVFSNIRNTEKLKFEHKIYRKNSIILLDKFFRDWLKVKIDYSELEKPVNVSLTLSEIAVNKVLSVKYFNVMDYFVKRLQSIGIDDKAKDRNLEDFYKFHANKFFEEHESNIINFIKLINENDKLEIYAKIDHCYDDYIVLSISQLKSIEEVIEFFKTSAGKKILFKRSVSRFFFKKRHKKTIYKW